MYDTMHALLYALGMSFFIEKETCVDWLSDIWAGESFFLFSLLLIRRWMHFGTETLDLALRLICEFQTLASAWRNARDDVRVSLCAAQKKRGLK